MNYSKIVSISTFSCKLKIIITDNINKNTKNIYKKYNITYNENIELEGVFISTNGEIYYLLINEKYLTHNTIAHETFHASCAIAEDRDIEDEETKAWLCGYITQNIYDFIKLKKSRT